MATKKRSTRKSTRRRKPRHISAGHRSAPKRRTKRRRKKSMLSEMVSHQGIKRAAKSSGGGLIGGVAFGVVDSLLGEGANELVRFGSAAAIAFVSGAALDTPNIAAGAAGAYGYSVQQRLTKAVLGEMENEDYADEDSLEEYPDAMDENGTPMYLADDGNFYYLEEFDLSEDQPAGNRFALAESFQANDMYPQYVNSASY